MLKCLIADSTDCTKCDSVCRAVKTHDASKGVGKGAGSGCSKGQSKGARTHYFAWAEKGRGRPCTEVIPKPDFFDPCLGGLSTSREGCSTYYTYETENGDVLDDAIMKGLYEEISYAAGAIADCTTADTPDLKGAAHGENAVVTDTDLGCMLHTLGLNGHDTLIGKDQVEDKLDEEWLATLSKDCAVGVINRIGYSTGIKQCFMYMLIAIDLVKLLAGLAANRSKLANGEFEDSYGEVLKWYNIAECLKYIGQRLRTIIVYGGLEFEWSAAWLGVVYDPEAPVQSRAWSVGNIRDFEMINEFIVLFDSDVFGKCAGGVCCQRFDQFGGEETDACKTSCFFRKIMIHIARFEITAKYGRVARVDAEEKRVVDVFPKCVERLTAILKIDREAVRAKLLAVSDLVDDKAYFNIHSADINASIDELVSRRLEMIVPSVWATE